METIPEKIARILDFIKKLSGINWYIVIDSKTETVLDHSPTISDEEVRELSELLKSSGNMLESLSKYTIFRRKGELARNMYMRFNGEGLQIETIDNYIIAININNRLIPVLSRIFDIARREKFIKCQNCGKDLTFQVITCPKCGRTIPFVSEKCPFCGYEIGIRKCPHCGVYIDHEGRVIKGAPEAFVMGVLMGILSFALTMFLAQPLPQLYKWIFYGVGGVFGVILALLGYHLSKPR